MQHILYDSVDEMLAPETLSELCGHKVGRVRRAPLECNGKSGSQLLAVETDDGQGTRFVLKRVSLERDWIMRLTEDRRCRSVALWQHGLLDRVQHRIEHAILACARDRAGWAMLMHDVSGTFLRRNAVRRCDVERVLDALAVLHSTFWQEPVLGERALGLCEPAQYLTVFSPEKVCGERKAHAIVSEILEGWELLPAMVDAKVVEVVRSLHRDPRPLCRALARYPRTLVHGDLFPGNLGLLEKERTKVVLLDWQLATALPPAADLAQCLSDLSVVDKEGAIAFYRHSLARQLGDRYETLGWRSLVALGALAFFVSRGWALPLFAGRRSTSEGQRAQQRANLAWFAEQVLEATKWL
jgi:hypothetical protein